MNTFLGIFILTATFCAAFWLARNLARGNRIFAICLGAVLFFSLVVVTSRLLSLFDALNSPWAWAGVTALLAGLSFWVGKWTRPAMLGSKSPSILEDFWTWFMEEGRVSKLALCFSAYFGFVIAVQLLDILILAPSQWDSFTYIMPRVLFYLQHGNLNPYTTNDLPQIAHVTGWSQIQAFGLIATGRSEIGFSIFSLVLFCVGLLATMESGRILSGKPLGGWIAGFVYATAVNVINLSSTPQSDMPIAGLLAIGLLGLVSWQKKLQDNNKKSFLPYVILVSGSFALAAVMKASALLVLAACAPIFILVGWRFLRATFVQRPGELVRVTVVGIGLAVTVFICGGYYSNYKNFGHPLGSEEWRAEHEFSEVTLQERAVEGAKNVARYLTHFTSLDGFYSGPPGLKNSVVRRLQKLLSDTIQRGIERLGWDLEESNLSRVPFKYFTEWPPKPISNSEYSYPGVVFIFALAAAFLLWWRNRQRIPSNTLAIALLGAGLLYLLLQSFMALYDPWRGRSFSNLVVIMAPISSVWAFAAGKFAKPLLVVLLFLGAIQGTSAIVFRDSGPLISLKAGQSTIFSPGDRTSQYSRAWTVIAPSLAQDLKLALGNYFWILPQNPKLATTIDGGLLVYPFLFNAKQINYYKSEYEIPLGKYDAALIAQPAVASKNIVKIGNDLHLWRKENIFPKRDIEDFDAFFGLEKYNGIGQVEAPYGKNGRSFRLMTSPQAVLQFKPIAKDSTLIIEASSIEVPNQIEVFFDGKLLGKIDLIKKGEKYKFSSELDSIGKEIIKIDLKASSGFDDKNQNRAIYSFIYKSFLVPKSTQKF